jgi:hypothetical protein
MKVRLIALLGTLLVAAIFVLSFVVFDQHLQLAAQAEQLEANETAVIEINKAIESVKANQIKMTSVDHNMSILISELVAQSKLQDQLISAMNAKLEAHNKPEVKSPVKSADKKSKKMMSINIPALKK